MRLMGLSTGALAKGDFEKGIAIQRSHSDAIEFSALREGELDLLIEAIPKLDLGGFKFISFHAPSRRVHLSERQLVERLQKVVGHVSGIVVHPDVIDDFAEWKPIEASVFLENLDQRNSCARTAKEMKPYFDALSKARFCFDLGHARQIDPTLSVAVEFLQAFDDRLAEIHISEVDASSKHVAISSAAMKSFRQISSLLPEHVPAIVESIIPSDAIGEEIEMAHFSLGDMVTLPTSEAVETSGWHRQFGEAGSTTPSDRFV